MRLAGSRSALDQMVHERDRDIGEQQAGDCFVDPAKMPERSDAADPDGADERTRDHHGKDADRTRHARCQHGNSTGADTAQDDRPLPSDHHETQPGRQGDAEGGEKKRCRTGERVGPRKGGAEARLVDEGVELDGRRADQKQKDGKEEHAGKKCCQRQEERIEPTQDRLERETASGQTLAGEIRRCTHGMPLPDRYEVDPTTPSTR